MKSMLRIISITLWCVILFTPVMGENWLSISSETTVSAAETSDERDTAVATASMQSYDAIRFEFAYKVDSVFANDTVWVELVSSYYNSLGQAQDSVLWTVSEVDATTSWKWHDAIFELTKDDSTYWGYLSLRTFYSVPLGAAVADSEQVDIGQGYNIKTAAFLEKN